MWFNLQACLVLAFAINITSGELPVPGLQNFLRSSMRNYRRWLYFVGLDPSETIPFVNMTDQNFDCEPNPCNYTAVGNITNYSIKSHRNVETMEVQANKTHFSIWLETLEYYLRGTYALEGMINGTHFNDTGEFSLLCRGGFVLLTCTNVGLTPDGFLYLSSTSCKMLSDIGNPYDCHYESEVSGALSKMGVASEFAAQTFHKRLIEGDLNPLPYYLKYYLEQLFKFNSKNIIANATLPPDFTNFMKEIEDYEYGIWERSAHPGVRPKPISGWTPPTPHAPLLPTVVTKSPLKNLPVPGFKNFLKNSMSKYADWLVRKGMDPSEKIDFVDISGTEWDFTTPIQILGNVTNSWIEGHSNIRNIEVHATETGFSVFINLNPYTHVGSYSTEYLSGTFKTVCRSGYVFIACKNIEIRNGYLDLSSAFIRTTSSHPWTCYDIFFNATLGYRVLGLKSYSKRVTQEGLSPFPGYLKMYLEELFKTTPVDVIAKTTPNSKAPSVNGVHPSKINPMGSSQTKITTKNNSNNDEVSELQETGTASCPSASIYCLISAVFNLLS